MPDIPVNTAALRMLAMAATPGTRTAYEKKAYDEWRVLLKIPGQVQKVELFPGGCPTELAREDCEYIAATQPSVLLALLDELDGLRAAALTKPKGRSRAAPRAPVRPEDQFFVDVDPQVVADFRALRIKHRAPITETAMKGLKREADRAGLTFEQALVVCCERGWRSLRANWLEREKQQEQGRGAARPGRFDPVAHVNKGSMPPPMEWDDGIIDINPR
jgi:hypothetical protein